MFLNVSRSVQETFSSTPIEIATPEPFPWYAIRTRSNFERFTVRALENKGFSPYLPTYSSKRRWSDRVVVSDLPLFPGYVFCRFNQLNRLPILTSTGVVSVIGYGNDPAPIADSEIDAVHAVLRSSLATEPCPFLREGQRVRVMRGSMTGVEGILVKKKSDFRLVVSIVMLQRSISVEIDRESIRVI
jgi:transcription antitermination factor NusG